MTFDYQRFSFYYSQIYLSLLLWLAFLMSSYPTPTYLLKTLILILEFSMYLFFFALHDMK